MRENTIDQDIPLGGDKRLIKRLWKIDKTSDFPDGLEFAYQFLYMKEGRWIQVVRIDNQLHEGQPGAHIHILNRDKVEWEQLTFEEAENRILELGERIIRTVINRVS